MISFCTEKVNYTLILLKRLHFSKIEDFISISNLTMESVSIFEATIKGLHVRKAKSSLRSLKVKADITVY